MLESVAYLDSISLSNPLIVIPGQPIYIDQKVIIINRQPLRSIREHNQLHISKSTFLLLSVM